MSDVKNQSENAKGGLSSINVGAMALATTLGSLAANAISGVVSGFVSMAGQAFTNVANYERMSMSLEALAKKEITAANEGKSQADIMALTADKAKELIGWTEKLAIQSPFSAEGVALAFKQSVALGFNTDEAKKLTQANIDWAAATGQSEEAMGRVALALGQMKSIGHVAGGEMMQLTSAGINVRDILAKGFGVTTEKLMEMQSKGLLPANKAIDMIVDSLTNDFGGAAAKQSTSLAGMTASLSDMAAFAQRDLFSPVFKLAAPYLAKLLELMGSPVLKQFIVDIGQGMAAAVGGLLTTIQGFVDLFIGNLTRLGSPVEAVKATLRQIIPPEAMVVIDQFLAVFNQISAFVSANGPMISAALQGIGIALGVIVGASAVIGIITGIAGALALIVSPVGLVVIAIAGLYTAWTTNFLGIRDTLTQVWANLQPTFAQIQAWLATNIPVAIETLKGVWVSLQPTIATVGNFITTVVLPALGTLATAFMTQLPAAIAAAIVGINAGIAIFQSISNTVRTVVIPAFLLIANFVNTTLVPVFRGVLSVVLAVVNKLLEAMAGLWQNVLHPALKVVGDYISVHLSPAFEAIKSAVGTLQSQMDTFNNGPLKWLRDGLEKVKAILQPLADTFAGWAAKIAAFKLPAILTPGSPTPMELGLNGILSAMKALNAEGLRAINAADFSLGGRLGGAAAGANSPGGGIGTRLGDAASNGGGPQPGSREWEAQDAPRPGTGYDMGGNAGQIINLNIDGQTVGTVIAPAVGRAAETDRMRYAN
jgi:tape measure domain-containing protein